VGHVGLLAGGAAAVRIEVAALPIVVELIFLRPNRAPITAEPIET
jgi:hypothetical protein